MKAALASPIARVNRGNHRIRVRLSNASAMPPMIAPTVKPTLSAEYMYACVATRSCSGITSRM